MSDLEELHREWSDEGLRIYALNVPAFGESARTLAAFEEQAGLTYPVLDHHGTISLIHFEASNSFPFPRDVIVGRDGHIAYTSKQYDAGAVRATIYELLER